MDFQDIRYETDGPLATITLARPRYRNAQSWRLLDEVDVALDRAMADPEVVVVIVTGEGDHFSSGHDLGTPDQEADREMRAIAEGVPSYDNFRHYNLDLMLKWRNLPKPTIAMVRGYCIFAGWMLASVMDIVYADTSARFLAALVEYFPHPWDIGARKAKELLFESKFIDAEEAAALGFVNRVFEPDQLEPETRAYAMRVSENIPMALRMSKVAVNRACDLQGYSNAVDAGFSDYLTLMQYRGSARVEGMRRLGGVDLAVRGLRGERYGLKGQASSENA